MGPSQPDVKYWTAHGGSLSGGQRYTCNVCQDGIPREAHHCKEHEARSKAHQRNLRHFELRNSHQGSSHSNNDLPANSTQQVIEDATRFLLASACGGQPYPPDHPFLRQQTDEHDHRSGPSGASPVTGIDWNVLELHEGTQLDPSPFDMLWADTAEQQLEFLNRNLSDDEFVERLDSDSDEDGPSPTEAAHEAFDVESVKGRKRARNQRTDNRSSREWYPWQDRITCTLDLLMHLPRSVFSDRQLDLLLWLLSVNKVDDIPSVKVMKDLNASLQALSGIETVPYDGAFGHRYFVNNLSQILAQEMCNPQVRPHLRFYPEDSGQHLSKATQGNRWLRELAVEDATPMFRVGSQDYYTCEPTMLSDSRVCMPIRWYQRNGIMYAMAWAMEPVVYQDDELFNHCGWRVRDDLEIEVAQTELLKNFPQLCEDHERYKIPHPSRIFGFWNPDKPEEYRKWCYTNPIIGNRWRGLAKGHRVMSLPLWLYCNDTSGNLSKKWNEHNSFLFTMAGLPLEHCTKEYNVHFLCTSNLAPPLEMMDGVVSQLEKAKSEGCWAWDIEHKELVLIFPAILALLGDNPMQSEFACHIGMQGKCFCRICMVKGSDAVDSLNAPARPSASSDVSDNDIGDSPTKPVRSSTPDSATSGDEGLSTLKSKFVESMGAMTARVKAFLSIGTLRSRSGTEGQLKSYFTQAQKVGTKTALKKLRTETGIKDMFQEFFLEKLYASYQKVSGRNRKQEALDHAVQCLPAHTTSPVWRIRGLDPHQDTPVEILHVVLLGFIKYFWRDLVQNQLKNKDQDKELLINRLSSVDVDGLGISPISARTLVQYAGSLTGRDFRIIAQVAPFVIHDLVGPECLQAWLSLSKLVPLIWQPKIENIDNYTTMLEESIHDFLLRTASWTNRWFNKPKFHLLVHLPSHIRRFGPAILFATETFESFNAVIRAKSVHSNRQAPSRDIAKGFAQGNRIRHLLSGGRFTPIHLGEATKTHAERSAVLPATEDGWVTIGPKAAELVAVENTVTSYLGLPSLRKELRHGFCMIDKSIAQPRRFSQTITSQHFPDLLDGRLNQEKVQFKTNSSVRLLNGDSCKVGQHVVVATSEPGPATTHLGVVREIVQEVGSDAERRGNPDAILIQICEIAGVSEQLQMPRLGLLDQWSIVRLENVLSAVNVQHDCGRYKCSPTGYRYVRQEGVQLAKKIPSVEHQQHPEDVLLNLAQMRSSAQLHPFRLPLKPLDVEEVLEKSVRKEIDARKGSANVRGHGKGYSTLRGNRSHTRDRARGRGIGTPLRSVETSDVNV